MTISFDKEFLAVGYNNGEVVIINTLEVDVIAKYVGNKSAIV